MHKPDGKEEAREEKEYGWVREMPEKAMAAHSSTLAWKLPWMEEPGGLQSMGSGKSDTTEWLHFHFSLSCIGEGNGNPLQCSCLENPRDGGAWWLPFVGSHRVGHDWSDLAAAAAAEERCSKRRVKMGSRGQRHWPEIENGLLPKLYACLVLQLCLTLCDPMDCSGCAWTVGGDQAPVCMGFSRHEN